MAGKRTIIVALLLASSLMLSGCKKKKPPLPAQAQAPTIPAEVPDAIPEVEVPQPTVEEPETKPSPVVTKKTKPRSVPRVEAKKTPPASSQPPAAEKPAGRVIVDEGGKQDPTPPPLTANSSRVEALNQRQNTNQLIGSAEYNIQSISRSLSKDEQAIVQHIRGFIEQSRQATKDGDTERAYNLAIKAHLLSDELVKK